MSVIRKDLGMVTAYAYAVSKGYTGTEEQFATLMASYADVGQTAVDAALAAKASEDAAKASETASAASQAAAATSAGTATTAAQNAAQSATAASGSATSAAGSATAAAGSATTAGNKATEAAQSATAAAGSATTAGASATAAQAAQTAAETAQTAAETAQGAAEDAAESVSASAAQIAQNTADISSVKNAIDNLIINHGNLLNNANKFVAPYNDFDTFKQNECVLITTNPTNYVANIPNGFTAGWVLTFNYQNVATGGLVQIAMYAATTAKGRIAWRKKWGSTWNTWYYFDNTTDIVTALTAVSQDATSKLVLRGYNEVTNASHPNLTDANDAEVNRIYSIQGSNVCANLPESKQGTLITFNYKDTEAGKIQLFHASSGVLYSRIYWSAWCDWIKYASSADVETVTNKMQETVNTAYKGLGNFIACGDSITRSLSYPTQGNYVLVKSWATSFAELCGSDTTIYARGGRSTADFIASDDYSVAIADTSQFAFLFLGINDINNGVSVADFKTNYTTIVNALLTNHDFVFCINIPACLQPSASLPNYNTAISEVCGTVSKAFLVDITEASARLNTYKNYGHLSSIGYAMMAGEIAKSVNQTMANNAYFTGQIDADNNA